MRTLSLLLTVSLLAACRGSDPEPVDPATVDEDADGAFADTDCNDADPAVFPGATEVCNGIDDNCTGGIDEEDGDNTYTWYADADTDGFGDPAATASGCVVPTGYVANSSDCNDGDPAFHPGASEADCTDANDYNCDGSVGYADADSDGVPACEDCDDTSDAVHPGATETCDGIDQDCDGVVDDNPTDPTTWYADADGDGHAGSALSQVACEQPAGFLSTHDDCNDLDAESFPGALEACDGVDNDCDGQVPTNEADFDTDGFRVCEGDCDDTKSAAHPGATEICDGIDNNCDQVVDTDAVNRTTWYTDADADGFGDTASKTTGCDQPAGAVAIGGDCDDTKSAAHPGATEICDGIDNNCDQVVDTDAVDRATWYTDADADGFGKTASKTTGCNQPSGAVAIGGDCDDTAAATHPGATEFCDPEDRDCDGHPTRGAADATRAFTDADGDGFGDPTAPVWTCDLTGTSFDNTDCEDGDATAFPGSTALETPLDGVDTDCDGNDFCTDLNCDGLPDIVVPSHHDGDYAVTQDMRILSGVGGLQLDGNPIAQSGSLGVEVADLDHDGLQDIVNASYSNGATSDTDSFVYWGATDHSESGRTGLPTHGSHHPCIGDLNNDGWEDLVFTGYYSTSTGYSTESYVYWSDKGVFTPTNRTVLPGTGVTYCSIDDLDNDGHNDVVLSAYYGGSYSTTSYVYWGAQTGFTPTNRTDLPTVGAYTNTVADLNGDGLKDIIFWSHHRGTWSGVNSNNLIYWNSPSGFSIGNRTALDGWGPYRGTVADLNEDGYPEILIPGYHNTNWTVMPESYIYWGNNTATYSNASRTTLTVKGALDVVVDDIDSDGHKDVLFTSHHDGDYQTYSSIFWGSNTGSFNNANRTDLFDYGTSLGAAVVDLDHDGYKDVFLPGYHNNGWANQAYSRVYWGGMTGIKGTAYSEWPTRGAWDTAIVGQ